MTAYAAGSLDHPFALVVATHVSMCEECRAALETHHAAGGVVMETLSEVSVSSDLKSRLMAQIALPEEQPTQDPVQKAMGIYPAPLADALDNRDPKWRSLGLGTRQSILYDGEEGSVRLLYIPAGQGVPDHGHNGLELTLVLQGSFEDEEGRFGTGDVEVADDDTEHMPVAGMEADCICLAATNAPLRFNSLIPRLLQPIFRI